MPLPHPCVPYAEFRRLRLSDFVGLESVALVADWEYMDRVWVGEAVGFSEWLCLETNPSVLGSMAVDFDGLDSSVVQRILERLGLPLCAGMGADAIARLLGEPCAERVFGPDRSTFEYLVGADDRYTLSCTVKKDGGLVYCTLISHESLAVEI